MVGAAAYLATVRGGVGRGRGKGGGVLLALGTASCLVEDSVRHGASQCGAQSNVFNPTLRLFSHTCLHISCTRLHTTSDDDQTRRHKKQKAQTKDKHHHNRGGAARPSSGVDLMNPRRPRGGRPYACSFQCRRRSDLIDSIN
jgi:hypothetical protein